MKNPLARTEGLEISLFRRLSEAHPESMVNLRHQYRMNASIMAISNRLVYHESLVCGTSDLASKSMSILPPGGSWKKLCSSCLARSGTCWLCDVLDPRSAIHAEKTLRWSATDTCSYSRHVVFVDTDAIPAREERLGRLVQNSTEAQLVYQVRTVRPKV